MPGHAIEPSVAALLDTMLVFQVLPDMCYIQQVDACTFTIEQPDVREADMVFLHRGLKSL
jgi:hypothetical protein